MKIGYTPFTKIILLSLFLILFISFIILFYPKPVISVIMPTYNRADLLPRAIDSILNQTFKDFEFIIVDDGSTDNTPQLLKEYAQKDSRIKILTNEKNQGISFSRNKGMNAAKGKYLAPMDSDDKSLPTRLEKLLNMMKKNPQLTVVTAGFHYEDSQFSLDYLKTQIDSIIVTSPEDMQFEIMFGCPFCNVCTLIDMQFIRKNNIQYNSKYVSAEDYDFWKQIILKGGKIAKIDGPVVLVRFHSANGQKYYSDQIENSKKIKAELFERFFNVDQNRLKYIYNPYEKCQLLKEIAQGNRQKKIMLQQQIDTYLNKNCPTDLENSLYLLHTWSDFITLTDKTHFKRFSTNETGGKYYLDGNFLLLKWDQYAPELFFKESEKIYRYKKMETIKASHFNWTDSLILLDNNRLCRLNVADCGQASFSQNGNTLQIKWDIYTPEIFKKNPKTNIFEYIDKKK